jgi:glycosyltransferase involved in cell wall biosynthesis
MKSRSIKLSVVFVQYFQKKYRGALEQLIALLNRLPSIEATLVVVDNAQPGTWDHEITAQMVHLGGDNSSHEFSAFDRGLSYLEASTIETDVYAFVTDAFTAYGDRYLDLIDAETIGSCLDLEACIGWVDAFGPTLHALGYDYRCWMRTSLFFMPASVLPRVAPICTPLEGARIFGSDATLPFLEDCDLSPNLRQSLLAWLTTVPTDVTGVDSWHSQFELTDRTFERFQKKVGAILREHLLSAKLQRLSIPCFDFRIMAKLAGKGASMTAEEREAWQWLGWRDAQAQIQPRYYLEKWECPERIVHGQPGEMFLLGWVATEPQVKEVLLELSDKLTIRGACDCSRPDVPEVYPEYKNDLCGFEIRVPIASLVPGAYEITFRVPTGEIEKKLGYLQVVPQHDFSVRRLFLPEKVFRGRELPVSLEGCLSTSYPLQEIIVLWNGQQTELNLQTTEAIQEPSGLHSYEISMFGEVSLAERSPQQSLELLFRMENGRAYSWQKRAFIQVASFPPHTLSERHVGAYNPMTRRTGVQVKGAVVVDGEDESLLFYREDRLLWQETLDQRSGLDGKLAWFELPTELPGIPPGIAEYSLALKCPQGASRVLSRWTSHVDYLVPFLNVETLEIRPPEGSGEAYDLRLVGWVASRGIEELTLTIDGKETASVVLDLLRPDVAAHFGKPVSLRQGFFVNQSLEQEPGRHLLQLVLPSSNGADAEPVLWSQEVTFEQAAGAVFRVDSGDLADLVEGKEPRFWSSICIEGRVASKLDDLQATLYVDNKPSDRYLVGPDGAFTLQSCPAAAGTYKVRVVFDSNGRVLYDSGPVEAQFEPSPDYESHVAAFEHFIEAFELEGRLGLGRVDTFINLLLRRNQESFSSYSKILRETEKALQRLSQGSTEERLASSARLKQEPGSRKRPLRVLYASWEVPCLRHGGGVWMTGLLKELSQRHEITVVYPYSVHEEGWVEDIRPFAKKVIGVRKDRQKPISYHEDSQILDYLYREYVPELSKAIESELCSGRYDIVDYQYTAMFPYISACPVPRVLTVFEEQFSAWLANFSKESATHAEKLRRLDRLLRIFYLSAVALPRTFPHLIAVTREDAAILRRFQNASRLHINSIGVDLERFKAPVENALTSDAARIVFLGNYNHPPSVDAARYIAEEVFPQLKQRREDAELAIVGAFPTPELEELGQRDGIRVTGFVDDHRPYLWQASAFVAPIFTGAGMRVKVLEAMACGTPVVATALAMQGIGAVDGEHFFRAENAEEFIGASRRCIESPNDAREVGRRGRELIAESYSSGSMAREREAIWQHVIDDWHGRLAPSESMEPDVPGLESS